MYFTKIECLVKRSKEGDEKAKEELARILRNFIKSIVKKYHINSYEFEDNMFEGYMILFECIKIYDAERYKFLGLLRICIDRHFANLLRSSQRGELKDGAKTLIIDENLENVLFYEMEYTEDSINEEFKSAVINSAFEILKNEEKEVIIYKYYMKKTLEEYAEYKGISYSTAKRRKREALDKMKKFIEKEMTL